LKSVCCCISAPDDEPPVNAGGVVKLFNAVKAEDLSEHTALTFHAYCVLDNKPVRFMAVVAVVLFVKVAAFKGLN